MRSLLTLNFIVFLTYHFTFPHTSLLSFSFLPSPTLILKIWITLGFGTDRLLHRVRFVVVVLPGVFTHHRVGHLLGNEYRRLLQNMQYLLDNVIFLKRHINERRRYLYLWKRDLSRIEKVKKMSDKGFGFVYIILFKLNNEGPKIMVLNKLSFKKIFV